MSLFDFARHDAEGHPAQMVFELRSATGSGAATTTLCLACLLESLKDPAVLNTCKCYAAKCVLCIATGRSVHRRELLAEPCSCQL